MMTNAENLSVDPPVGREGSVRLGSQTGDPTGRYCANLGHKQDDESGLIYMRARYYEPTSGRFVSEDPGMAGGNWFVYCGNQPISNVDSSGKTPMMEIEILLIRVFQGLSKADTLSRIVRIGNAGIRHLMYIAQCQRARAEDQFALAEIANAAGAAETAEIYRGMGARSMALAAVADLAILQIRAMMFIAEIIFDIL